MLTKILALTVLAAPLVACAPMHCTPPAAKPPAAAADSSAPRTREQVQAEVLTATADGSINDYNGLITVAREWPGSGSNAPPASSCR